MRRNIFKQAETGKKIMNSRRDISISELEILFNMAKEGSQGLWNALTTAIDFGFYQGYEQRRTEEK